MGGEMVVAQDTGELVPVATPAEVSANNRASNVAMAYGAAMNRASTLILTPEESKALQADFPDEAFKRGAAGKENLIYIEHAFLRDRLTEVLGMGQWALLRTRPHWAEENGKAVRVYADCCLIIRGCMVSEAVGEMTYYPNNAGQDYSDAAEGAMTAAFRRCAKNFGIGLQAWKKDWCDGWLKRNPKDGNKPQQQQSQPVQTSIYNTCLMLIKKADSFDKIRKFDEWYADKAQILSESEITTVTDERRKKVEALTPIKEN